MRNMFCDSNDLHNEDDVETLLLDRLLVHLGYRDSQIRRKNSLSELSLGRIRGIAETRYRPDYAISLDNEIRWIIEAKAPDEELTHHIAQPRQYCVVLNGQYEDRNPLEYYLLGNGLLTRLYKWDVNRPILELSFQDFVPGNAHLARLTDILHPSAFHVVPIVRDPGTIFVLRKEGIEEVNAAFAWCHQCIYRKDNLSQAAAFEEFVKVVFLKLLSDRRIRDTYPAIAAEEEITVPSREVLFSTRWLIDQERQTPNPLDMIQYQQLLAQMDMEIAAGTRKRIFDAGDHIGLSPETIRAVVGRLEHLFLFGVDADLNGRLFETFLNATMRGKDLGQYFTPRSIVKLGTGLASLRVSISARGQLDHDVVLDACCGSGGFLIEALATMWKQVDDNVALSDSSKHELKEILAHKSVVGIDVGRDPNLARIARMNMYLHGDGGSSIYQADSLDKTVADAQTDSPELRAEKAELRQRMAQSGGFADVVLTNPPFAKAYERSTPSEALILNRYEIGFSSTRGHQDSRSSLKSSLMFVERYHDLLKPGGRLVTVIDDGILGGEEYRWFRDFVRQKFNVRAVISLPGDAFQRSKARVKTSLIVLEKPIVAAPDNSLRQGAVFMYPCKYVGVDDPDRQRTLPIDRENRISAAREIQDVLREYSLFENGEGNPKYTVPAVSILDRLDVKSCLEHAGRLVNHWRAQGMRVLPLSDLASVYAPSDDSDDVVLTAHCDDFVTYVRITYDGFAVPGDQAVASETGYARLYRVHSNDLVVSNIGATYGSIGVVPAELDGCVVTSEYTILKARQGVDPRVLWLILRTPDIRADMLITATGISRTRVKWNTLKRLQVPVVDHDLAQRVVAATEAADAAQRLLLQKRAAAEAAINEALGTDTLEASEILTAFKPPQ